MGRGLKQTLTAAALVPLIGASLLAGCGRTADEKTTAPVPPPEPAADALPAPERTRLQGRMAPEQTLEILSFAKDGETVASGEVRGYRAIVYAVPVAAGQTLQVDYRPAGTNTYINVGDAADTSGAALFRGEVDGKKATLSVTAPTIFFIAPFQTRATARRGDVEAYSMVVKRGPAPAP